MAYSRAPAQIVPNSVENVHNATAALPGSAEKIALMTRRASARMSLFHPQDARQPAHPPAPQTGGPGQRCPGVSRRRGGREGRRYRARLWLAEEGHDRHLGYYDTEEQAVRAVALAREKHRGNAPVCLGG